MQIAICPEPNRIEIQSRPVPAPGARQVLLKVHLCGVCGSDLAVFNGSGHKIYPYSPGHELCGTVVAVGNGVANFQPGQRVVVDPNLGCGECPYCRQAQPNLCDFLKTRPVKSNGGLSEYVALDQRMLYLLPAELPDELAPFVEPLSCALHVSRTAAARAEETAAVFGAGLLGLLTALLLRDAGGRLLVIEPNARRREQIADLLQLSALTPEQFGASEWNGQLDVAVDCSGNSRAVSQAIRALRKARRLVLAGLVIHADGEPPPLMEVTCKELTLQGVWLNPLTFPEALELAVRHKQLLSRLKIETFRLAEIQRAFERALCPEVNKVIVVP
jgi:L-iditol 2-dehydrogenase